MGSDVRVPSKSRKLGSFPTMSWRGACCWRQLAAAVPSPRFPAANLACFAAARQTAGAGPASVPQQPLLVRVSRRSLTSSAPALAAKDEATKKRRRGRERHAGSAATVKPGDWNCVKCGGFNFAGRTSCFVCCAPKPEVGPPHIDTQCRSATPHFEPVNMPRSPLPLRSHMWVLARPESNRLRQSRLRQHPLPPLHPHFPLCQECTHACEPLHAPATKRGPPKIAYGYRVQRTSK